MYIRNKVVIQFEQIISLCEPGATMDHNGSTLDVHRTYIGAAIDPP